MLVLEFRLYGSENQFARIDESIRTTKFIRNTCLRLWMDSKKVNKYDLNKHCAVLAEKYDWCTKLNSTARQASAERAWSSVANFYEKCKNCKYTPICK